MGAQVPYLVVVMELDRVPLAVTDPAWDVGGHCGLCLAWKMREEGMKKEESGGWEVRHWGSRNRDGNEERKGRKEELSGGQGKKYSMGLILAFVLAQKLHS